MLGDAKVVVEYTAITFWVAPLLFFFFSIRLHETVFEGKLVQIYREKVSTLKWDTDVQFERNMF